MVAERAENNSRPPWEELSPGLRDAVECVLNDPLPEELTRRALEALRRQVARYPRKPRRRILSWTGSAIAASIVLIALAAYVRATQADDGRSPSRRCCRRLARTLPRLLLTICRRPGRTRRPPASRPRRSMRCWTASRVNRSPPVRGCLPGQAFLPSHPFTQARSHDLTLFQAGHHPRSARRAER